MAVRKQTVAARATTTPRPDLNRIAVFVAVVEAASFTRAARTLGLPKSSVSRAVSRLEEELGITLLTRSTRKLALTEAGARYLSRAREALSALEEAHAHALDTANEPRGLVRFTASSHPDERLAELLARFVSLYPRVQLDLLFTARRVDLLEEGVDLALRAGQVDDASLAGRRIGPTPHVLVAAPSYLARRGVPRRVADLARHDCILYRAPRSAQRWTLTRKQRREAVDVRGLVSSDDMRFTLHMAAAGAGIALVPHMVAREALDEARVQRVLPEYTREGDSLYLVHPAIRALPRRVVLLRDFLLRELREQFTEGAVDSGAERRRGTARSSPHQVTPTKG